jgi:hypothetical protein
MLTRIQTSDKSSLTRNPSPILPDGEEVVRLLRIPEVSSAADHHNVIENLKRMRGLPRIHLCGKALYPLEAVTRWIDENTTHAK